MSPAQWQETTKTVTDAMTAFVKPFVTPLSTENTERAWLLGTGTYVEAPGEGRRIVTCEHVVEDYGVNYQFRDNDTVLGHTGPWRKAAGHIDAAEARVSSQAWAAVEHAAQAVPMAKFARRHAICDPAEPLFFYGYGRENSAFAFETLQSNGSGYCSPEIKESGDSEIFEMFWRPEELSLTDGTSEKARANMSFVSPKGFSGALVWNTRFLEVTMTGSSWSPEDARVTGLLRRWDTGSTSLLAWRVEHLLAWLAPA